jgi:hypothetical protein
MATSSCRFCTHSNPAGAKFCNECGSPLALMPCPSCSAISDMSAGECHQCGRPFDAVPASEAALPGVVVPGVVVDRASDATDPDRAHIPESLARHLDAPRADDWVGAAAAPAFSNSTQQRVDDVEADDASRVPDSIQLRRRALRAPRRTLFERSAFAALLAVVAAAGYYAYSTNTPIARNDAAMALAGKVGNEATTAASPQPAGPGGVGGASVQPPQPVPPASNPASSATRESDAPVASPAATVTALPPPAAAQSDGAPPTGTALRRAARPATTSADPASRLQRQPDASASATRRASARQRRNQPVVAPRPSAQAAGNRDAIETQRLIQRDLAPFVRNGAASGTFPAIN